MASPPKQPYCHENIPDSLRTHIGHASLNEKSLNFWQLMGRAMLHTCLSEGWSSTDMSPPFPGNVGPQEPPNEHPGHNEKRFERIACANLACVANCTVCRK